MNTIQFDKFLAKLSETSEEAHIDPRSFAWPDSVEPDSWYFTPELISLYGSEAWENLDESARRKLSFYEAVNFFSLNIHGEKYLISEISRRLFNCENAGLSRYLTHFVEEEARHMMYFSEFCRRYAGKIYPDRSVHSGDSGDEELDMLLLFARINVFEEVVDYYNRTMSRDARLEPTVREINRIHHIEELRHLNFGRRFLARYLEDHADTWTEGRREFVRNYLAGYLELVWKQYDNPDVYADAGIENSFEVWQVQLRSAEARNRRLSINGRRLGFLRRLGLLEVAL